MDRQIIELLLESNNIDISRFDESFLTKSVQKRIVETNCDTVKKYCGILEKNEKERALFLDSLNISYSEFFRNPLTFSVLEKMILPAIVSKMKNNRRKEIRIWSAACAGGQEAYSIAMLLEELNGASEKINYRIFATDQSEVQIKEASSGQYYATALNNLSLKRGKQWFSTNGETYTIKPELKKRVDFSVFDLFSEQLGCPQASIFGDFDIVICANLLFYYKKESRKILLEKVGKCLSSGGFIVTGESEREILLNHNYRELFAPSAIFCLHDTGRKK